MPGVDLTSRIWADMVGLNFCSDLSASISGTRPDCQVRAGQGRRVDPSEGRPGGRGRILTRHTRLGRAPRSAGCTIATTGVPPERLWMGIGETHRLKSLGIQDIMTQARSPWQNGYIERLIGSIRRECLDHVIVFNECHLMRVMGEYIRYYNESRTHLGLGKASPDGRPVEPFADGPIRSRQEVGGLHRRYHREAA